MPREKKSDGTPNASPKKKRSATRQPAAPKPAPKETAAANEQNQRATPDERSEFIPRIVVFACNWCSYAGADTAGTSRLQYSPYFRIIRVMCSGRIHPAFIFRAFELGADGVLVSGCHFGDCHYIFGNERAVEQFEKAKAVLKILGLEEGRLRLEWISAAEGVKFAQVINEFVAQVTALGPSRFGGDAGRPRELPTDMEEYADAGALAK